MQVIQATATTKIYPMDRYDGGRAASEPEHYRTSELGCVVRPRTEPEEEDVRTLALAVITLTSFTE